MLLLWSNETFRSTLADGVVAVGLIEEPSDAPRLVRRLLMSLELTLIDRPKPCVRLRSLLASPSGGVSNSLCLLAAVSGLLVSLVWLGSLVRRMLKLFLGVSLVP